MRSPRPERPIDQVLFELPVTKNWLRQTVLGLTLICHSSYRGVSEFCRDLLGINLSSGTVHNIMRDAVDKARPYNLGQKRNKAVIPEPPPVRAKGHGFNEALMLPVGR